MNITSAEVDRDVVEAVPILWFPTSCLSRRAEPHDDPRPAVVACSPRAHGARSRLAPTVLADGRRRDRRARPGARPGHDGDRQPGRVRGCGRRIGPRPGGGRVAGSRPLGGDREDGRRRRAGGRPPTGHGSGWRPYPIEVVCGLGAGDAFGGALCHGLLSGWDLVRCARAGNAAGAIVASRLMCADDMPFEEEIDDVLDR